MGNSMPMINESIRSDDPEDIVVIIMHFLKSKSFDDLRYIIKKIISMMTMKFYACKLEKVLHIFFTNKVISECVEICKTYQECDIELLKTLIKNIPTISWCSYIISSDISMDNIVLLIDVGLSMKYIYERAVLANRCDIVRTINTLPGGKEMSKIMTKIKLEHNVNYETKKLLLQHYVDDVLSNFVKSMENTGILFNLYTITSFMSGLHYYNHDDVIVMEQKLQLALKHLDYYRNTVSKWCDPSEEEFRETVAAHLMCSPDGTVVRISDNYVFKYTVNISKCVVYGAIFNSLCECFYRQDENVEDWFFGHDDDHNVTATCPDPNILTSLDNNNSDKSESWNWIMTEAKRNMTLTLRRGIPNLDFFDEKLCGKYLLTLTALIGFSIPNVGRIVIGPNNYHFILPRALRSAVHTIALIRTINTCVWNKIPNEILFLIMSLFV